jgi:WD40 repeat protein
VGVKTRLYSHTPILLLLCLFLSLSSAKAATPTPTAPAITALVFSPDGKRLAVGTYGEAVVYDTSTWLPVSTFLQVEDTVRSLCFRADGQVLAIGSGLPGRTGRVTLWDISNTQPPRLLTLQQDTVEAVAFDKSGNGILLGSNDNKARYYGALPSLDSALLDEHNGRVDAVAFSPNEKTFFVTGGMDKMVKVWDEKSRHVVVNLDQSEGGITGLAFLPNGTQFVGSSLDGRLYWWGVGFDQKRQTYNGYRFRTQDAHAGGVFALGRSEDGKRIITGGADHLVNVWDSQNGKKLKTFKDAAQPVYSAALNLDGKIAAAAGREGVVWIWDVEGEKLLTTLTPPALPAPPVKNTITPRRKDAKK